MNEHLYGFSLGHHIKFKQQVKVIQEFKNNK